jgi:hypothetical protein
MSVIGAGTAGASLFGLNMAISYAAAIFLAGRRSLANEKTDCDSQTEMRLPKDAA